jgi:hypothetical protein
VKILTIVSLSLLPLVVALPCEAGEGMPSCRTIYQEIEAQLPGAEFDRESHIRLGRVALAFVKPIARWALDDDDEALTYLSAIKKVDIATYRVVDLPEAPSPSIIRNLEHRMLKNGWIKMLRERDDDDNTWVFLRQQQDGSTRGVLVIELDDSELSIVGVEGRIDDILTEAIANEPGEFSGLFGS